MQNRGALWIFTVLLALACVYQLSFSVFTSGLERKASAEAKVLAGLIADVLEAPADEANLSRVRGAVAELCDAFPVYR